MKRLQQKRALITGGASGLGRALALNLAREGWKVAIVDLNNERLASTAKEIKDAGGTPMTMNLCVTQPESFETMASETDKAWGGVDLLVNNAGVAVSGRVGDAPLEDWRWIFSINLWGVIHGCHTFVPRMRKQGGGHIVNTASAAGIVSAPEMAPYNVTKAGVISLSETLRSELINENVGVTVVCPTFFATNLVETGRFATAGQRHLTQRMFEKAKLSADDVAEHIMAAVRKNRLYVIPQKDGKASWLFKRMMPGRFHDTVGKIYAKGAMEYLAKK